MNYDELLKNAPAHDTPEFVQYLRDNNVVEWDDKHWLVIRNFKYWKEDAPWLTAFHVGHDHWTDCIYRLLGPEFSNWNWLKKATTIQTVNRFHIHLYK